MPRVGLEPTIPAFERPKTVHALERVATVIGCFIIIPKYKKYGLEIINTPSV
jgi:hypothetical protein